ncbi:hypothetical protein [Microbacterium marinilacus]|uniref:Peptidase A2 domain-containing protein n=1 Tax=Microbacterium marinilacus TaxID=415209 RepID=A0ABP7BA03_9MICO|nr:hypothetical protein [Microbacterium marinilacus]MBY0687326.1 hypothetical protein [Microbacterium marinilacus]
MNPVVDAIVWLANFPVTHGYAMVFIAGFSSMGLIAMAAGLSARRRKAAPGAGPAAAASPGARPLAVVQAWLYRVLAVGVIGGGVLGLLSLTGVSATGWYIHQHGATAEGTRDGDWITFTASDGVEYTVPYDFFTPASYPDTGASLMSDVVTVRYLESHPQTYVVDTGATDTF